MKGKWTLGLVVGGLGMLWWCTRPNRTIAWDVLPLRLEKDVAGPNIPPFEDHAFPFLTSDFTYQRTPHSWLLARLPLRSRVSFFVNEQVPVKLALELRFVTKVQQEVTISLNGREWKRTQLSNDWQSAGGNIEANWLHLGKNQLTFNMEFGQSLEFRKLALECPKGPQREQLIPPSEQWHLPWDQMVSLPIHSAFGSRLEFDSLELDAPPGVAIPVGARLQILWRGSGQSQSQEVRLGQSPKSLTFPSSQSGWAKLQLRAQLDTPPLPGQQGLVLKNPRLRVRLRQENWNGPDWRSPKDGEPPMLSEAERPPVILYLIDTLRADHLGCYGRRPSPSPRLDEFSRDAVLFEDMMAQSSWTKPATASIMSSQWPWRHKVQDFADKLPPEVPWMPQLLQQAGYATAGFVANKLAGNDFGYQRGYDTFTICEQGTSEAVHEMAVDWLEHRSEPKQPFFLYLHTIDPHSPYMHSSYRGWKRSEAQQDDREPAKLSGMADTNRLYEQSNRDLEQRLAPRLVAYDNEISNNDKNFGKLVDWLKANQLYDQSLIIVISDHGEEFLEHGYVGHVASLHRELLQVPLLVKFPQQRGAGKRITQTWQQIDVAPTVLRACGVARPSKFQGQAFLPEAPPPPPRPALFSVQAGQSLISHLPGQEPIFINQLGIRQGSWVYHRVFSGPAGRFEPEQLYDLASDPQEQKNLAQDDPGHSLSLALLLGPWYEPTFQPNTQSDEANRKLLELLRSLQYVR